jgi:metal-sulfur cluster biosynthetic enzyme
MDLKDFIPQSGESFFRDFTKEEIQHIQKQSSIERQAIATLKLIHDPEMSVNIHDLGLIYKIDIQATTINIKMTLTSATCPVADFILKEIKDKLTLYIKKIKTVDIELVWEPKWHKNMMSEEAKFTLGIE